jgi:hypothetical protein
MSGERHGMCELALKKPVKEQVLLYLPPPLKKESLHYANTVYWRVSDNSKIVSPQTCVYE